MKSMVTLLLAICLAQLACGQPLATATPAELAAQVQSVIDDVNQMGKQTGEALVHQYQEIVLEPQHELEEAYDKIEARRLDSPDCVAAEDEHIEHILEEAHAELHTCGVVAAHTSAEIATDVNAATQQLVFGGYSVINTYQKCQKKTNSILKKTCMTNWTIQATMYLVKSRSSIKTIKKSTERVPEVFTDSNVCTHMASAKAVSSLDEVNQSIDKCAAKALVR